MTVAAGAVALKIIIDGFIDNDKKCGLLHTQFKTRVQKPYPIYVQIC